MMFLAKIGLAAIYFAACVLMGAITMILTTVKEYSQEAYDR